jgi:hypothetical protein
MVALGKVKKAHPASQRTPFSLALCVNPKDGHPQSTAPRQCAHHVEQHGL